MTAMKLAEFAKWAIQKSSFVGCDLNGGDVQEKAEECGLLVETKYDPDVHGDSDYAEPGDPWYVYSDEFKAALKPDDR